MFAKVLIRIMLPASSCHTDNVDAMSNMLCPDTVNELMYLGTPDGAALAPARMANSHLNDLVCQ